MIKIRAKKAVEKAAQKPKRDRRMVGLYLSHTLYRSFKTAIAPIPVGKAVEELMKQYLEQISKK